MKDAPTLEGYDDSQQIIIEIWKQYVQYQYSIYKYENTCRESDEKKARRMEFQTSFQALLRKKGATSCH
jgi:hypothetical protein